MNQENELDDLFRKKLEDPVDKVNYNEADWNSLEQKLDKRVKRRGFVYWLPVYGSVAAMLLLFFGYLAFRPKATNPGQKGNPQVAFHQVVPSGVSTPAGQKPGQSTKETAIVAVSTKPKAGNAAGDKKDVGSADFSQKKNKSELLLANTGINKSGTSGTPMVDKKDVGTADAQHELLSGGSMSYNIGPVRLPVLPVYAFTLVRPTPQQAASPGKKNIPLITKSTGYRPQFALTVLAAPDINGVGSFQQSKVGTNEGLLFTADLSRKFTISTGAVYSVKPYITGFENYHTGYQFPVDPVNVTADCRMLDIPINLGYQLYNRHQNSITVGTGLSSYIMLHESYKFNYAANSYITGPDQFTVPNSKGYYFGILNLNATFQHQINSKVGFNLQPYVKLPLTNVGYSQVRLQTTGVALGLTWNINSVTRP